MDGSETPLFITDDEIARRIRQAEDALTDVEHRCGVLRRELTELRKVICPTLETYERDAA